MNALSILYRGHLESCNYGCPYCPFAKRRDAPAAQEADRVALERFVNWVEAQPFKVSVFFTPWGEALVRERYRKAIVRLSRMPGVERVAIQTNLSCNLRWVEQTDKSKVAFWATFHPTETEREKFLAKCHELVRRGMRFSVGSVGTRRNLPEIEALRAELPPEVYLWVNAYKARPDYYTPEEIERLKAVDPYFELNLGRYVSRGKACRAGEGVIAVDADGNITRCHFIPRTIGNIYDPNFAQALQPRPCSRALCDCHIGYVHLSDLGLYDVFDQGILERIPAGWPAGFAGPRGPGPAQMPSQVRR